MTDSLLSALVLIATATSAVAFGLWIENRAARRVLPPHASLFSESQDGAVFLFDGEVLVDCSPAGRAILAADSGSSAPWARLMGFLAPLFDGLEEKFLALGDLGHLSLASSGDRNILLTADLRGGLTRISLVDADQEDKLTEHDPMTRRALSEEVARLRTTVGEAPMLIWRERADGTVTWANTAYVMALAERLAPDEDFTWPLGTLFEGSPEPGNPPERRSVELGEGDRHWYELQSIAQGTGRLVFAIEADRLDHAERSLREVMVTLTKTFAHLHVGLAVFDRQRQLQLFNPALTDLTGLPVDFLISKPTLAAVLDSLHERNLIPEPRDYRSWRGQLMDMEEAAASGHYEDTWSLPSGRTYRVIGRPHPDGALALFIEDISDEITRSRRYRAEIELGLSVLDGLDEAIAVFAQSGQLVMSNAAYSNLWGHDPAAKLGEATLGSLLAYWKERSAPTPLWESLKDMAAAPADRAPIRAELRLTDGRLLACRFAPIEGGATLAAFTPALPEAGIGALVLKQRLRA